MNNIDRFKELQALKFKKIENSHVRFLFNKIEWDLPLTILIGGRGTGKTTLLLQHARLQKDGNPIYINLDNPFFEGNRLYELIENYYKVGGRRIYLDEVHKYEYWAKDVKHLTDSLPDLKIALTGSSAIEISKQKDDLSRRSVVYKLPGLSFREFLLFDQKFEFPLLSLEEILINHIELAEEISGKLNIKNAFNNYLKFGYYPFFLESKQAYPIRLVNVINQVIETDLPPIFGVSYKTVRNLKKLLYVLAQQVPFKPNIASLAQKIEIGRNQVLKLLDNLNDAGLINLLKTDSKGKGYLTKPEKVFLENPNLSFALCTYKPDKGTLRESFFYNQLAYKHEVSAPKFGDFFVDEKYLFEVGGATKSWSQVKNLPSSFLALDDIVIGNRNKIPLWLFGFLY